MKYEARENKDDFVDIYLIDDDDESDDRLEVFVTTVYETIAHATIILDLLNERLERIEAKLE